MTAESLSQPDPTDIQPEPENLAGDDPGNGADGLGAAQGLTDDLRLTIGGHAEAEFPNECCGFIIRRGKHVASYPVRNISSEPHHDFHGHPEDVASAEDTGELLMSYHSHPNGSPAHSMADKTNAERNQLPSLTIGWPTGDCEIYYPTGWKADLLGRPFVHGVLDCFTLVKDRLAEDGIIIPDFEREDLWWEDKRDSMGNLVEAHKDYYLENFEKLGFRKVDDLKPLDCILMQLPKSETANHCAVYEGDGIMIHHPPGRISTRQPYLAGNGYFALATRCIVRHESRE